MLSIPSITADDTPMSAAFKYANAGIYVGPVKAGTKSPGSVLGKKWHEATTTDPQVIADWYTGSDDGVFIHAGRSGLVVFDVDNPDATPELLARAIAECSPPFQTTRADGDTRQGHYLFAAPAGVVLGNGTGSLGPGWGDVRGRNGVIVVAPSQHASGGRYEWQRTGAVPTLPDYLLEALPTGQQAAEAATSEQVEAFLQAHTAAERPELVTIHAQAFTKAVASGASRHETMRGHLTGAMKEARAGLVEARTAADALRPLFLKATTKPGDKRRTEDQAAAEWAGMLAWAVAQGEASSPEATRQRVAEKCPDVDAWTRQLPGGTDSRPSENFPEGRSDDPTPPSASEHLDIVCAADVQATRVRYLWAGRIPIGAATLMPGEEGIGKTTVGTRIMADLTRGDLPGEHRGKPRGALILSPEDGIADVLVPRLEQAGADRSRVHFVRGAIGLDGETHGVILPRDLERLSLAVRELDIALVWVDSLAMALPDELKSISYKDTAKALGRISDWAEREGVAVVAPWHLNKASGTDTGVRIMDSRAFRTAVRSMLLVTQDPVAPEGVTRGIVALDKANAGTLAVPALRYELRSAAYHVEEVDKDTGEVHTRAASCGVAVWVGEVEGDGRAYARAALAPKIEQEGSPQAWLRAYLTDEGESLRSDVLAAAREDGLSEDQVKRAARALRVVSTQETGHDPATNRPWRRSVWSLPGPGEQSGAPASQVGATCPPTAPSAPTVGPGETYKRPTTSIYAGEAQSVQSVQSEGVLPQLDEAAPLCAPLESNPPETTSPPGHRPPSPGVSAHPSLSANSHTEPESTSPPAPGLVSCADCGDPLSADRAAYGASECADCHRAKTA